MVIIIKKAEYSINDLGLYLSLKKWNTDNAGKIKSRRTMGSHSNSNIAPTAAYW